MGIRTIYFSETGLFLTGFRAIIADTDIFFEKI